MIKLFSNCHNSFSRDTLSKNIKKILEVSEFCTSLGQILLQRYILWRRLLACITCFTWLLSLYFLEFKIKILKDSCLGGTYLYAYKGLKICFLHTKHSLRSPQSFADFRLASMPNDLLFTYSRKK